MASKRKLKRRNKIITKSVNKAATQAIAKTKRNLKAAAKAGRLRAQRDELQFIENLLGEDFETLSQARTALKRDVSRADKSRKKAVKKFLPKHLTTKSLKKQALKGIKEGVSKITQTILGGRPPSPAFDKSKRPFKQSQPHIDVTKRQKIYSIRELRDGDKRAVMAYLEDRLNANALSKELLGKDEKLVAQVTYRYRGKSGRVLTGYANTYETYPSFASLFMKLSDYGTKSLKASGKRAEWLNQIKIMKWDGGAKPNPQRKDARKRASKGDK